MRAKPSPSMMSAAVMATRTSVTTERWTAIQRSFLIGSSFASFRDSPPTVPKRHPWCPPDLFRENYGARNQRGHRSAVLLVRVCCALRSAHVPSCGVPSSRVAPSRLATLAHELVGSGLDESALVREHYRLYAIAHPQLLEDARYVRLHGRLAEVQPLPDLGVREAARQEVEHLELPAGELAETLAADGLRWRVLHVALDEPPGERGRQQRLAGRDGSHSLRELARRRVLQQESAGTRAQRLVDVLVEVECREHQDPRRGIALGHQPPRRLDAVQTRHADVHDHDVGVEPDRLVHGRGPILSFADDVDIGLRIEHSPQAAAHQRVVIRDQYADHFRVSSRGSLARTRKPPSASSPASNRPPNSRTRSRMPKMPWPPPP